MGQSGGSRESKVRFIHALRNDFNWCGAVFVLPVWVLCEHYAMITASIHSHHPQTDGLMQSSIQTLEGIIRRYSTFGMEYTKNEGFLHDWVTLLPGLEYAYRSTIYSTTWKKWPQLIVEYLLLNNKLVKMGIHSSSTSFSGMQARAREPTKNCISEAFEYEKEKSITFTKNQTRT